MEITLKAGDSLQIPEGCKATIEDNLITIIEKKQEEFKEGDILHSINTNMVLIFKNYKKCSNHVFDSYFNNTNEPNSDWFVTRFRHATEEEKQILFDKMKEQGLRWNAEEKRVEKIRWRALPNETYYFVTTTGMATDSKEYPFLHITHDNRHRIFNYFRTREQAEKAAEVVKEALRKYHEEIGE